MNGDESKTPPNAAFSFSPQQALEFMQQMWNPFGVPVPGFPLPGTTPPLSPAGTAIPGMPAFPHPAAMFPALDPAEVERKIAELRIIEGWLTMSLNMMQMSIKTLELQKASLEALRSAQGESGGGQGGAR
jgi:hypothetical protein